MGSRRGLSWTLWLAIGIVGGIMSIVGGSTAASAKEMRAERLDTLALENLAMSRLTISVGDGAGGWVRVTPDAAVGEDVEMLQSGGRFTVRGRGGANATVIGNVTSMAVGSGAQSHVSIGGQSVTSSGGRKVAVEAQVPAGTTLRIGGVLDRGTIGAVGGDLTLDLAEGDLSVGSVRNVTLTVTGHARITVDKIEGDARLETTGEPTVRLQSGQVGAAQIRMTGAGSITVGASVREAQVELVGDGQVSFASVSGQVRKSVIGAGSVRVGR